MIPLDILMQFPADTEVSATKLIIFWISVVICVLAFLYFLRRTDRLVRQRQTKTEQIHKTAENIKTSSYNVHDEEAAAIALAIHLYKSQMHDMESFTITLNKVSRIYSPWSSKIYTLRQNPRH